MLVMKIITLYYDHCMKYIDMLFGHNIEVFSVKTGGKCSNHYRYKPLN